MKPIKRWLTIAMIFYFSFCFYLGWVFLIISLADEINDQIKRELTWLQSNDWERTRDACVILGALIYVIIVIRTLD